MPLYGAALEGSEQVVSMLLAAGADINLQKEVFLACYDDCGDAHVIVIDAALAKLAT